MFGQFVIYLDNVLLLSVLRHDNEVDLFYLHSFRVALSDVGVL